MTRVQETMPSALAGERIDRVVAMITGCSRAVAAELVVAGAVEVGDVVVGARSAKVAEGDVVTVELPEVEDAPLVEPDATVVLTLVHVDDAVIVVDKPAGLVVHPGSGNASGTLVNGIVARFPEIAGVGDPARPGVVHRIDKGTSGLLMVARTEAALGSLGAQLAAHTVEREYQTLVWGVPSSTQGVVDAPIGRSGGDPTRMAVSQRGRPARTHYEVVESFGDPVAVARLDCQLETGRTHQIRVHMAAIGHAVVGDGRYGGARSSLPCPRPFLHAARLGFEHPTTGEHLRFESALPADLVGVLDGLS